MKIGVIGTGYVGLVQAAGLAFNYGHDVMCMDINAERIAKLRKGIIPIHEPGLSDWVNECYTRGLKYNDINDIQTPTDDGRLYFSDSLGEACGFGDVIFICVGTPPRADGSVDLSALAQLREDMWRLKLEGKVIIVKSTVPPGTSRNLFKDFFEGKGIQAIGMNPEFLKEGYACEDFANPDRIIIGIETNPKTSVRDLDPIYNTKTWYHCSLEDAELTKYASNGFLAMKISYAHEIQNIAIGVGANYNAVLRLVGLDSRIGSKFLTPGIGYGGSCFPKDVKGLENIAIHAGVDPVMIMATDERNEKQVHDVSRYCLDWIKAKGLTKIGILGLAFKENTDDIRESTALKVTKNILRGGFTNLKCHDPQAIPNARKEINNDFLFENLSDLDDCDGYIVLTPWPEYKQVPIKSKKPILDMRNYIMGPEYVQHYGEKL